MPWQGVAPVDLRERFNRDVATERYSMTELCEQYMISRKTGYHWVARYRADGRAGLADRSRRPHRSPRATDPAVVARLCDARRRHPFWSARKLLRVLQREDPTVAWPRRSTGCAWLKRFGLVRTRRPRQRQRAPATPLAAITRANAVWTTDFKGQFRTGDGQYCYPFTLRDGFSRYVLRCDALATTRSDVVQRCFARAFAEYGLPDRIRSDNGGPFAGVGLTRLSRLAVWWLRLGILPERIALGHPEQNGSHEQFHRVLKAETTRPPAATLPAQHRRFQRFVAEYNLTRPHEALGDETPASCYHSSPRALPRRLPAVEYAGYLEVRRVSSTGAVSWGGDAVYLTEVLAGEDIAFEEVDDGIWMVWFAAVTLARFDARARILTAVPYATR
jgi:transposase InsO family protein